jgi:hypothetical protein
MKSRSTAVYVLSVLCMSLRPSRWTPLTAISVTCWPEWRIPSFCTPLVWCHTPAISLVFRCYSVFLWPLCVLFSHSCSAPCPSFWCRKSAPDFSLNIQPQTVHLSVPSLSVRLFSKEVVTLCNFIFCMRNNSSLKSLFVCTYVTVGTRWWKPFAA